MYIKSDTTTRSTDMFSMLSHTQISIRTKYLIARYIEFSIKMTYEMMKKQIEKVGCEAVSLTKPSTSKVESTIRDPFVKVEPTFHGNCNRVKPNSSHICNSSAHNYNSTSSSEEDDVCENAFYGHNRNNFGNSYQSKPKLNPTDQFGIVTTCEYCKSVCHWLQKCPDAPPEFKQRRSFNKKKRSKHPL